MAGQDNPAFAHAVQNADLWLKKLEEKIGGGDANQRYQWLKATLQVLRDRLRVDDAAHLAAQLPVLIRGAYYEGWRPAATPSDIDDPEEFCQAIAERLQQPPGQGVDKLVGAVFQVLEEEISPGEADKIRKLLPERLRGMTEGART